MARPLVAPLPRTLDGDHDVAGRGDRAALLHAELHQAIAQREADHLAKLVAEYRNGTLTDVMARNAVVAIAEGRTLLETFTRAMRLGHEARARMAQPTRDSHERTA